MGSSVSSLWSRGRLVLVYLGIAIATPGCDAIRDLRAALHGEEAGGEELGNARLRVEVNPPDGITVLLDDVRVASMSPYTNDHLTAGKHTLEVRAMGYHSFKIQIVLEDDETLSMPIALRRRPKGTGPGPRAPPPPGPQPAPPPPPAPVGIAPKVPPGVKAIALHVVVRPAGEISLDGVAAEGRMLNLERVSGRIGFAGAELRYRIGSAGLLFFTVPADGATWEKGGKVKKPGAQLKHNRGVLQLKRTDAAGETLTVLLKR